MFQGLLALCLVVAPPGSGAAAPGRGTEIDRVVAVVRAGSAEPRILTMSRVEEETRIALVANGGLLAASAPLDAAALAAGLQALIDETLLGDDAARLQVFDSDAHGDDAIAAFRGQFPTVEEYRAFLRRWDLSDEDVSAALRRKARVQRYLDSRVSHAAQVSEGEITAWLDENAVTIGTRDRDLARARLAEKKVAAEVQSFVRDLRARSDVRILPTRTDAQAP